MTRPYAQPLLIQTCGLPFAGKSTLARAVALHLGAVHIEVDAFHDLERFPYDGDSLPKEAWVFAYRCAWRATHAELADGNSVVFDATGFRRTQRDKVARIAREHGAHCVVLHVATPDEVALERLEANRVSPTRGDVPDSDFVALSAQFQVPGGDEPTITYDPAIPLATWLRTILVPSLAALYPANAHTRSEKSA